MNRYPYTDMHEMNLDWILLKVKEMIGEWDTTKNAWTELKNFVETYFENLDVQQEINGKLDEMAAGGELADLMAPYVDQQLPHVVGDQIAEVVALQIGAVVAAQLPGALAPIAADAVGDWLSAHVDPDTGYVIDDTLTVTDAAADAKVTGDKIDAINHGLKGNTVNNLLKYPYPKEPTNSNGLTFVFNDDFSITVNGTSTDETTVQFLGTADGMILKPGTYTFSGCTTGSASTYEIFLGAKPVGGGADLFSTRIRTAPYTRTLTQDAVIRMNVHVLNSGVTMEDVTFYPAIYHGSVDADYTPNYESNKALYDNSEAFPKDPILCVSTYRDRFSTGTDDYYYAVSYDGTSFQEIKASKTFAGSGLISSDVQPIEWNDGLLMVCTSYAWDANPANVRDFRATFTPDFVNYYSADVNLGFMDAAYSSERYVWAPQICKIGNKYYAVASISIGATEDGDVYGGENAKTRYLHPYFVEVDVTFSDGTLTIEKAAGANLTSLNIEGDSIMDVSLFYSSALEKVLAIYKDRIYNIVNLATADAIDGEFSVYEYGGYSATYLSNTAYAEAGFLTYMSGQLYAYLCHYKYDTNAYRRPLIYNKNMTYGWEVVGCVNPSHYYADGRPSGMRNPYPIQMSNALAKKFARVYACPSFIPKYEELPKITRLVNTVLPKVSEVIYKDESTAIHTAGKYTQLDEKQYYVSMTGSNDELYLLEDSAVVIVARSGDSTIVTPNGTITISQDSSDAQKYLIAGGQAVRLSSTI